MLVRVTLAMALLGSAQAQARPWFVVSVDGNRCLDAVEMQEETLRLGGRTLFTSPQQLMDALRYTGAAPSVEIRKTPAGGDTIAVTWVDLRGQRVGRTFFADQADCAVAVARMINEGAVPGPGTLR